MKTTMTSPKLFIIAITVLMLLATLGGISAYVSGTRVLRTGPFIFFVGEGYALAAETSAWTDRFGRVKPIFPWTRAVKLEQVNFEFERGYAHDTNWGQVAVLPAKIRQLTGECSGYVNVFLMSRFDQPQWVVDNLIIPREVKEKCDLNKGDDWLRALMDDPFEATMDRSLGRQKQDEIPMTRYFNLRPIDQGEGRVSHVLAVVLFSPQPFPISPEIVDFVKSNFAAQWFAVAPVVIDAEGDLAGAEEMSSVPTVSGQIAANAADTLLLIGPPPPVVSVPSILVPPGDLAFPIEVIQDGNPNINAGHNQCVPMSHANAIKYLEGRYNSLPLQWEVEHLAARGIGLATSAGDVKIWVPVPDYSVVAQVDTFTRRENVKSLNTGDGSSRCQNIVGLLAYLKGFGEHAKVVLRHQGGDPIYGIGATCSDTPLDIGNLTSTREGEKPTWEWIFDQLSKGRSVVMSFGRYDMNGEWYSGHMLRVYGAARYNNKDYLMTVDDADQGNNFMGLRWKTWEVADMNEPGHAGFPNGYLELDGLSWEIHFALSMEAKPTLLIP